MTTYRSAGVDVEGKADAMGAFLRWLGQTHTFPGALGRSVLENGFYAAVHDLNNGTGIAISTDSVGTKVLIAEAIGRYDTVGIDCVAINANDVLCVGARPIALVDYLAVQGLDGDILEQLGKGLYEGARQAGIAIAGGELAQVPELLKARVDLAGTCIGIVSLDRLIDGRMIQDGDAVIGLASSGLHSNGYTLARKVLLDAYRLDSHVPELGCTLADELLKPTATYVQPVQQMLPSVTGLAHISGGGLLNLLRFQTDCGFELDRLPDVPAIFGLIADHGSVPIEEMYRVFNMGVGFCVVVRPGGEDLVLDAARRYRIDAWPIGTARAELNGQVVLTKQGLTGKGNAFRHA